MKKIKPTLEYRKYRKTFAVVPSLYFGLYGVRKYDKVLLPDSLYGEYYYYINGTPKYYYCVFGNEGDNKTLTEYLENMRYPGDTIGDKMLLFLKQSGIRNVSIRQIAHGISLEMGEEYFKEFELLEICP